MVFDFKKFKDTIKTLSAEEVDDISKKLSGLLPAKKEGKLVGEEQMEESSSEDSDVTETIKDNEDKPVISIEDGDPYIKNIGVCDEPESIKGVVVETVSSGDDGSFDNLVGNYGEIAGGDEHPMGGSSSKLTNNDGKSINKNAGVGFFDKEASTSSVDSDISSALTNESEIIEKIYLDWEGRYDASNWKSIGDSLAGYVTKYVVIANRIHYNNLALEELFSTNISSSELKQIEKIIKDNIYMNDLLNIALGQIGDISTNEGSKEVDTEENTEE